jgi:hypothetical protein
MVAGRTFPLEGSPEKVYEACRACHGIAGDSCNKAMVACAREKR